jgi:transposase
MKEIKILGIDLAKRIFQLHGVDERGHAILRKKIKRDQLLAFVANLKPCLIGMEACGGAHYWAREFQKLGHEVKLVSPQFVKPFVKTNKNDANDSEAIVEAIVRPSMRFVPIKQTWQQNIQNLHRVRERLVKGRTALSNEIRGLLNEYGIILETGVNKLIGQVKEVISNEESGLSERTKHVISELTSEFNSIQERISRVEEILKSILKENEDVRRIETIPGIGLISATALVAAIGDPKNFKNGRHLSAWLGLVPRQNSSGGKTQLLGISKRGDCYLRKLLIHGARSNIWHAPFGTDKRSQWLSNKMKTRGNNRAVVALANKNARIVWALLSKKEEYRVTA